MCNSKVLQSETLACPALLERAYKLNLAGSTIGATSLSALACMPGLRKLMEPVVFAAEEDYDKAPRGIGGELDGDQFCPRDTGAGSGLLNTRMALFTDIGIGPTVVGAVTTSILFLLAVMMKPLLQAPRCACRLALLCLRHSRCGNPV